MFTQKRFDNTQAENKLNYIQLRVQSQPQISATGEQYNPAKA